MNAIEQINHLIESQAEPKRTEMRELHSFILNIMPDCRLWYFDGTNDEGKIIANPTIGYGQYEIKYKNEETREFFQIGLLPISTGIAIHIMGIEDKSYLSETIGKELGKASVSSYSIKFKSLKNINQDVLEKAIRYRIAL